MIWFPAPIYKFLPYLYAICGVTCILLGIWTHVPIGQLMYFISGALLLLAGATVLRMRWKSRSI